MAWGSGGWGSVGWGGEPQAPSSTPSFTGTMAVIEQHDVLAASALLKFSGSMAISELHDIPSISGSELFSATMALIEQHDVISISGTLKFTGTITVNEQNDIVTFTGTVPTSGTPMPNLIGFSINYASGVLYQLGNIPLLEYQDMIVPQQTPGIIFAQSPDSGVPINNTTIITLTLSGSLPIPNAGEVVFSTPVTLTSNNDNIMSGPSRRN